MTASRDAECTPDDMIRNADIAMYRAKMSGKAQFAVFDEAMHNAVLARLRMERQLRGALGGMSFR
jgi:predicted signal transduction protein with EAL and GGDEF domain